MTFEDDYVVARRCEETGVVTLTSNKGVLLGDTRKYDGCKWVYVVADDLSPADFRLSNSMAVMAVEVATHPDKKPQKLSSLTQLGETK